MLKDIIREKEKKYQIVKNLFIKINHFQSQISLIYYFL